MKTRYVAYNGISNDILVWRNKKAWWHNKDNTISMTAAQGCEFSSHVDVSIHPNTPREITYHQFIMWLCFGEPIV